MKRSTAKRLHDAIPAIEAIERFTQDMDYEAYASNEMAMAAVERKFEIISEALKNAAAEDASIQASITVLPQIIGLRNRIAHAYEQIDQEILWTIRSLWLPRLKAEATDLLADYQDTP
jgi:uncharacterized protein with HEPN domain